MLFAHQDTEYEEWGFSGSIRYQPQSDGRGLSVNLGSTWGQAQSGVQSLWPRLGVKLTLGENAEAGLEVGRLDSGRADGTEGPEHAVQLRSSIRW